MAITTNSTIVGCTLLIMWGQAGFANPASWLNSHEIETYNKNACTEFVKDHKLFPDKQIRIGDSWSKNSKQVYEIIASTPGEKSLETRLCVIGKSTVGLVPPIQEGFWQ